MKTTPTEKALLNVLSDGEPHKREELFAVLPDEMARTPETGASNILKQHLFRLRGKLRPIGYTIVCEYTGGRYMYRWVRLLVQLAPSKG